MNLFLVSLTRDILGILHRINETGKNSASPRSQIMEHIVEYVQLHSNAKELRASVHFSLTFKLIISNSIHQIGRMWEDLFPTLVVGLIFVEFAYTLWLIDNDSNGNSFVFILEE